MDDFLMYAITTACLFAGVWLIWDGANGFKR
jgi:hypothetical protein